MSQSTKDGTTGGGWRRAVLKRLIGYPLVFAMAIGLLWIVSIRMPGQSHQGPVPTPDAAEQATVERVRAHVETLAVTIGPRSFLQPAAVTAASDYIAREWSAMGLSVTRRPYRAGGRAWDHLEVTIGPRTPGRGLLVVGAHYDGIADTPGADDNASGVAVLLEASRLLVASPPASAVRLVAFANEEPPWFWSDSMGSVAWLREARQRGDTIAAMLSIECVGYFTDTPGSQRYPPILGWFYPDVGNFLAVVGNVGSRALVHRVIADLRQHTPLPTAGAAAPSQLPGVGWSDHWAFWQEDVPAVMLTDAAPFRNPYYHQSGDVPAMLDFPRMARVAHGVARVTRTLARDP